MDEEKRQGSDNNMSPTGNDIKFGKGGNSQHPGNIWLRSFLHDNYKEIYEQSDKAGKTALRKRIISEIHDSGRSFYMMDDKSDNWHVVNNRNVIGSNISRIMSSKEDINNQLLKAKIRKYASVQHNASQKAKDREGRSTQLSNLSTSDEKSSPKSNAAVEKSASSTSPKSFPRPVVGASTEQIIRLTKEQCSKVTFPIGCPVWYGFSVTDGDTTTTLKCGLVSSAMLQGSQLFYEVEHRNKDDTHVTEQVKDSELCFGASCPIIILPSSDNSGGGGDVNNSSSCCEGEIVLCTPSTTDTKKFVYTAMIFLDGGSRVRYESGIEANRVKYRRVGSDEKVENSKATPYVSSENPVSASEEKDKHSPRANNDGGVATPVANVSPLPTKGLGNRFVPPVISVGNSNSGSVDSVSSRKRARPEKDASTTVKEEFTPSPQKKVKYPMDDPDLEIIVPLWLQKDRESQGRLFRYLLGKRGRNLKRISQETQCRVSIGFDDKGDSLIPMKIHLKSKNERTRLSDLKKARLILEGLFLGFVGKDEGCRGRLVYELAKSTGWGSHIPKKSTSNAVRGINPMSNDSSETYMSVVELPSHYASMERHHNEIRNVTEANGCKHIIVRRDNTQMCDPYVLIYISSAKSYENVDRSVTILEDKISQSKTQTPLRETGK